MDDMELLTLPNPFLPRFRLRATVQEWRFVSFVLATQAAKEYGEPIFVLHVRLTKAAMVARPLDPYIEWFFNCTLNEGFVRKWVRGCEDHRRTQGSDSCKFIERRLAVDNSSLYDDG